MAILIYSIYIEADNGHDLILDKNEIDLERPNIDSIYEEIKNHLDDGGFFDQEITTFKYDYIFENAFDSEGNYRDDIEQDIIEMFNDLEHEL